MTEKSGGIIGLIIGLVAGAIITWYLMRKKASEVKSTSNLETWDMWEENGHIKVEVHRNIRREPVKKVKYWRKLNEAIVNERRRVKAVA